MSEQRLTLPEMRLWVGPSLGSGRDLLVMQIDVYWPWASPGCWRDNPKANNSGILRVLFIEK